MSGDLLVVGGVLLALLSVFAFISSRRRGGKVLLVAVALMIAGTWDWSQVPVLGDLAPKDSAEECRDVAFLGLRGSGERRDAHRGYGGVVGPMRDELRSLVLAEGQSFADMPVDYPALGLHGGSDWSLIKDLLRMKPGESHYLEGAGVGADLLASKIKLIKTLCEDRTAVVVAGYSQGAMAAHMALGDLTEQERSHVVSVDLIADPLRPRGKPNPAPLEDARGRGIAYAVYPYLRESFPHRSWCLRGDLVCETRGSVADLVAAPGALRKHTKGYGKADVPTHAARKAFRAVRLLQHG